MRNREKRKRYRKIFLSTLYLSSLTFGGGYVIVTLLKQKFVDQLHWIDDEEMVDLVAIAQSSPGAIAVNGAIVVGYKLGGLPGVLFAVLGSIIPPFIILTAVSAFYTFFRDSMPLQALLKGMKSGVCAIILSTVYDMTAGIVRSKDAVALVILPVVFCASYFGRVNMILIILLTAALGVVRTVWHAKWKRSSL